MHDETTRNVQAAMRDEAFGHAMFWVLAERAHAHDSHAAADLLERAAAARRDEHFVRLAELLPMSHAAEALLSEAIQLEAALDYSGYARSARAVGDTEAAELLMSIQAFREAQLEALRAARMRLQLVMEPVVRPDVPEADLGIGELQAADEPVGEPAEETSEPAERPAAVEDQQEYHVLYVGKQMRKTIDGARELEARLARLHAEGWELTATLGSQLILRRISRPGGVR
jgi:hypothetical protein